MRFGGPKLFLVLFIFTIAIVPTVFVLALPRQALAHEQYVLPKSDFDNDYSATGVNVWDSLKNPDNFRIASKVGISILIFFVLYFFLISSRLQLWLNKTLAHLDGFSHALVRVAVGFSFIYSAATSVFLGPEIPHSSLPFGLAIHYALYVVGALLVFGFLSEISGLLSLVIILAATWVYKDYMITYFNYFGEFLALLIFGSRVFSIDKLIFGIKKIGEKFRDYEIAILRVTYGIAVLYPAITIKLFHPEVILDIVNRYKLNQIHWLFPPDPLLIALGTGLAQILVGICIIVGFETRLASLATLVLYILSILFFREVVWPHYILLALAFYLVVNNGGKYTIDTLIENFMAKRRKFHKSTTLN